MGSSVENRTGNKWRARVMLACFGILILAMLIVFLRFFTAKVMIHKFHMDNAWTQMLFADNAGIVNEQLKEPEKKITIDWAKKYPFPKGEIKPLFARVRDKQVHIEQIFHDKVVKKVEDWTTKDFIEYPIFIMDP